MNNKRTPTSKKVCTRLIKYCIDNGLDYQKYVFIPFQKEFNSANLSLIKTKNNLLKMNLEEAQQQIERALENISCQVYERIIKTQNTTQIKKEKKWN